MKLAVTGGAGFIGSNYISEHLRRYPNDTILCIDKLTYAGKIDRLMQFLDRADFRFFKADICDREKIKDIFDAERPDAVINFAAESHVDRSIDTPDIFLKTNILGVQVLMDTCRMFGNIRFHQISTDEVYGDLPIENKDLSFTESDPLRTSSPYSASKAAADLLVTSYYRTFGLPVTISRSSNNYGPNQHPEKLIPHMIACAVNNRPLPIYGNGKNVRDWIYVADHCHAIDQILQKGKPGEIYNVGANEEHDNLSLVCELCALLHKPESLISFVPDRKGHDLRYALNTKKIRTELGWQPETSFEKGLHETVNWYIDHPKALSDSQ